MSVPTKMPSGDSMNPPEKEYFFVRRPVLAAVISIVIVLLGLFAMMSMPLNRYPNITPPSISVTTVYPGATAQDVASAVAAPIEQQLSGLEGVLYYKSSNTSDGTMNLEIYFDISRNPDLAAVDVQNAVNTALPLLPASVRQNGVTVNKVNADILLVMALTSTDPSYDASYLTNYMKLYVADELKRIPGVGSADAFGGLDFSMLLSLDPEKMAQLGITVDDVSAAVQEENSTKPAGRLGRQPSPQGTQLTISVSTSGRLTTPAEFEKIIVRARPDGSLVRLGDIAVVTLGSRNYDMIGRSDGVPSGFMFVNARPGANQLEVRNNIIKRMDELAKVFPDGVSYQVVFDTTPFITASIKEVGKTLAEAMILVTLVVFLFLQSWRATLIPLLAVPVSLVGTFLGLQALGFTINSLTLFAMVVAIGIVVDDAIVVIENVERIMAQDRVSPRVAANRAMRQVSGALIAIVLVLCAVFVPVAFLGGITGALYQQFAVTLVIAIVLSGVVALTLTPALCALLLKHAPEETENRFFKGFNNWFAGMTSRYVNQSGRLMQRPRMWMAVFGVLLVLTAVLFRHVPSGFIPTEDKGFFVVSLQLPDGASLERTEKVVERVEAIIKAEPSVKTYGGALGFDLFTNSTQSNSGAIFVMLKPWNERSEHVDEILARINGQLFGMKDAIGFGFNFPEVPGLGLTAGLDMYLQQRTGDDINQFAGTVQNFMTDVGGTGLLQNPNGGVRTNVPQLFVEVNEEAARARGVMSSQVFSTLQSMLSTLYINDFNLYGRTYRVQAEAQAPFRQRPEDIGRYYVRSTSGEMIPLSALVTSEMRGAPTVLTRFNGFTATQITGANAPGKSSGEVLNGIEQLVIDKYQPQGIGYAYAGESYQQRASEGTGGLVLVLGMVLVFLVLAAQYESWSIPFAVLLGLPFGALGALLGIWFRGLPNDLYFQIGLMAVLGLAAKNAILIVEFATELRQQGLSIREAAMEAASERFRPILMTSFAFILGVLPLVIAGGAGAASRHAIGTGVFAGMLFATIVGIFFIPLFFYVIRSMVDRDGVGVTTPNPESPVQIRPEA